MGILDKYEKYRIYFRVDTGVHQYGTKCSTKTRSQEYVSEIIESLEAHGHEVKKVKGITSGSFSDNDTFNIEELREPAL